MDEDGKPIKGARVRVRALETSEQFNDRVLSKDPFPVWLDTVETNESGAFRADAKSNAVVEMMIDAPGRQFASFDVVDGEEAAGFILRKAAPRKGRVTAGGKGVAGAVVILGRSYVARTDAEGYYDAFEPGVWLERVLVIHPDYAIGERSFRERKAGEAPSLDVTLTAGYAVRGSVVDSAGRGVAGAIVRAGTAAVARSGEDGSFEIPHAAIQRPPLVAREGNRAGSLATDQQKPPYVIQLRPGATITGMVRSIKDEAPVAAARVYARADFDQNWSPYAITDAKGNFTLTGVESGARRVIAAHPAYFGSSPEMRVGEGERLNTIVVVTPYARMLGKIIDEEKKPVGGARFTMMGSSAGTGPTASAPDGSFALRLPPATRGMTLSAGKNGFAPGLFGPYMLEPGETRSGVVLQITRGIRFEIRLTDRDGAPIANELVSVTRTSESMPRSMRISISCGDAECRTDKNGSVSVSIAEGAYDIGAGGDTTVRRELRNQQVSARVSPMTLVLERGAVVEGRVVWSDGSPAAVNGTVNTLMTPPATAAITGGAFVLRNLPPGKNLIAADSGPPSYIRSEQVEVDAPAKGVVLTLMRGGRIEGRVAERDTNRAVRDFTLFLEPPPGSRNQMYPPKTLRTEDGRFALEDVPPGVYDLRVQASGFIRTNATSVTVDEAKTATASVQLERGATVVGRVTSQGRPLPDVMVSLAFNREDGTSMTMNRPQTTDANGEFTMDGLPAGTHRFDVRSVSAGYVPKTVSATVTPPNETRIDVELERGRELRGRVVDSSGRPLAQAEVSPRGGPVSVYTLVTTDDEGAFKLSGLADARYTISARKDDYVEGTIEVNPASAGDVTITLNRGGTIHGRVLGLSATDLGFVEVRGFSSRARTQPDAAGAFTLNGVADGDTMIVAMLSRPRHREVRARVTVINGSAPPVDLDFNAGIAVRGKVTQEGKPVRGSISFNPMKRDSSSSPWMGSSEIGPDGSYEVRLAASGEYGVTVNRVNARGMVNVPRVNVAGDMVHDIELRGATLSGRVLDAATGELIPNAIVTLLPGSDAPARGGRFTLDLLADGDYRIRAQARGYAPLLRAFSVANGVPPAEMDLALSRGVEALFRVTDALSGELVDARYVTVMDAAKAPLFMGETPPDAAGMRRIMLQPGTYQMTVLAQDYASKQVTLTVPGPPMDVRLDRTKR